MDFASVSVWQLRQPTLLRSAFSRVWRAGAALASGADAGASPAFVAPGAAIAKRSAPRPSSPPARIARRPNPSAMMRSASA